MGDVRCLPESEPRAKDAGPEDRPPALTGEQLGCMLTDIARSALAIQRFAMMQLFAEDRDIEAARTAIEQLAERIGMTADRASERVPGAIGAIIGAEPEAWTMPPTWHDDEPGANRG